MMRQLGISVSVLATGLIVLAAAPAQSEAGLFFRPSGSVYYYQPASYPVYYRSSYYAPVVWESYYASSNACCGTACNPCSPCTSPCDPCGSGACGTCPCGSSPCDVTACSGGPASTTPATPQPDGKFTKPFKAPTQDPPVTYPDDDLQDDVNSAINPNGKMPAPTGPIDDLPLPPDGAPSTSREGAQPTLPEVKITTLNLEHNIARQAAPTYERLAVRSNLRNPRVNRARVNVTQDWVIAVEATQLARRAE